jgi:hypothetical protein
MPTELNRRGEEQLSLPTLLSFTETTGSTFEVVDLSPSLALKLTRVVGHASTPTNEAFSVFFLGPGDIFMSQGTRTLRHDKFGEMEIFLVPVAKTNAGFEYEAVFNYILNN